MHDLVIIGSGPAGLTAGIYAGRFKLDTLIFEKASVGGQIILSSVIENYPGFPGGISTHTLIDKIKEQIKELGINIENHEVVEIKPDSKSGRPSFTIKTQEGVFEAKTIIIATGASPRQLAITGENKFVGRGVSYCGTCDGPLFKNKDIVVIGGGDRAIEEAIFLSGFAQKVNIIHRRSEFRASQILVESANTNPKINFILDSVVEEIKGKDKVEEVLIKNVSDNTSRNLPCQGVFIFAGIRPNTDFIKDFLQLDESGFIIADQDLKTSVTGIFACGDCRKKNLYQVITACGDGAVAANSAHKYLSKP